MSEGYRSGQASEQGLPGCESAAPGGRGEFAYSGLHNHEVEDILQNENETAGPIPPMDGRLRGTQQTQAGHPVRHEAHQQGVGGHAAPQGSQGHHGVQAQTHRPVAQKAALSDFGINGRLSRADIKRAFLERVQAKGKAKGAQVPSDLVDFMASAEVHCFDAQGKPVDVGLAIVTWER